LSEAMVHGAGAHTYGKKLMTRDDSVLLGGHPRDRRIACCSYRQTALSFVRRTRGSSSPRSACKSSAGPCSRSASVRFACSAKGNTPLPCPFSIPQCGRRTVLSHARARNDSGDQALAHLRREQRIDRQGQPREPGRVADHGAQRRASTADETLSSSCRSAGRRMRSCC
jgi:hypothetical protein